MISPLISFITYKIAFYNVENRLMEIYQYALIRNGEIDNSSYIKISLNIKVVFIFHSVLFITVESISNQHISMQRIFLTYPSYIIDNLIHWEMMCPAVS